MVQLSLLAGVPAGMLAGQLAGCWGQRGDVEGCLKGAGCCG
jgi:hypothetical protein